MTDDQAAEPGGALPVDLADDARFDLLATPLAGAAPAPHVGTHVVVTAPGLADEPATEAEQDNADDDDDDDASEPRDDAEPDAPAAEPDGTPDLAETADLGAVGTTLPMWLPASAPNCAVLSTLP